MNYYFIYVMFFSFMATFQVAVCSDQQRPLSLIENIAIGGIVGAAEVAFPGQIINYTMNCKIDRKPFELLKSYKGFQAHALGQMPIVAIQKGVQAKGSQSLESFQKSELSEAQKIIISYMSGVAGAFVDTPSNSIQLFLQQEHNHHKSTIQAVQELKKRMFHGFTPNALIKEGPFAVGYQYLEGKTTKCAQKYMSNNTAASVAGGVTAGIITACITQPGAVLRNTMQKNSFQGIHQSTFKTIEQVYKKNGVSGLFAGLKERGTRVAVAIPLYLFYSKSIEDLLKR